MFHFTPFTPEKLVSRLGMAGLVEVRKGDLFIFGGCLRHRANVFGELGFLPSSEQERFLRLLRDLPNGENRLCVVVIPSCCGGSYGTRGYRIGLEEAFPQVEWVFPEVRDFGGAPMDFCPELSHLLGDKGCLGIKID